MTWGDLSKLNSLRQTLRRGLGLPYTAQTMRSQDSVLMCVRPLPTDARFNDKGYRIKSPLKHVRWPEDKLMWEYVRKNPDVKQIPYRLDSFQAPFLKRFALRQLELMRRGKTKEEAYAIVAEEMQVEKAQLIANCEGMARFGPPGDHDETLKVTAIVQEEEEQHLRAAMQRLRKRG